jgi:hypothetical protein
VRVGRVGQRGLTERELSHHRLCAWNQANTDTAGAAKGEVNPSVEERRSFLLPSISFPNRARENKSRAMSLLSNSERRPISDSDTPPTKATVILLNLETTLERIVIEGC